MNRLVILDDDLEFSRNLLNYIVMNKIEIRISSLAINAEETMQSIDTLEEGDILLLDLDLPQIDEVEVIKQLKQKGGHMPYIIVMSRDMELLEERRDDIPYINKAIKKPFAFRRIATMIEKITYHAENQYYEKRVKEELRKFEMNITTIGYAYMVEAITLCLQNEELLKSMKDGLYKTMSQRHNNLRVLNIKWTIEKFVKSVLRYTSFGTIRSYFHVEAGERVSPKHFISMVVDTIKSNIENERKEESTIRK